MSESKAGIFQRMNDFVTEVRTEMKKVTWPTWEELKASTTVTLILLGIMAAMVFVYDQVFQQVVLTLLRFAG